MSKNFYEEGFPDDDPTDELPILTDVIVDGDDEREEALRAPPPEDDTDSFNRPEPQEIPTLEDRDETATELVRDIADRDAKLAALESELANLELRWRETSDALTSRDAELAAAQNELQQRQATLQSERDAAEHARAQLGEREDALAQLTAELDAARSSVAALEENARALEQQIIELETSRNNVAALEENARALEQQIVDLENTSAQQQEEARSRSESVATATLRQELAALAGHIESRNAIWRRQIAEVAAKSTRIRELELEIAQRMAAQNAAERLAEIESDRARDYRERLVAATAALDATQLHAHARPAPKPAAVEPAPRERARRKTSDEPLAAELERAVALQQSVADDSEGLRRLEELEVAIRELEKDMDEAVLAERTREPEIVPPQLICLTGEESESHRLDRGDVVIGRGSHCTVRVMTHYISREHARIANKDGQYVLEDLGSRNGVFVNSVRIDRQALSDDDLITIGDTQFRFRAAHRPAA